MRTEDIGPGGAIDDQADDVRHGDPRPPDHRRMVRNVEVVDQAPLPDRRLGSLDLLGFRIEVGPIGAAFARDDGPFVGLVGFRLAGVAGFAQ